MFETVFKCECTHVWVVLQGCGLHAHVWVVLQGCGLHGFAVAVHMEMASFAVNALCYADPSYLSVEKLQWCYVII